VQKFNADCEVLAAPNLQTTSSIFHPPNLPFPTNSPKMMSLRTVARAAPRALGRASATPLPRFARTGLAAARPSLLRAQPVAAFSTSLLRQNSAKSEVDEEVSAKLASEIKFEKDVQADLPQPASVKDFLENGLWKVEDVRGQEVVTLTRTYGNEK
jgi:complement component 1 Q subcomponent-binding protein